MKRMGWKALPGPGQHSRVQIPEPSSMGFGPWQKKKLCSLGWIGFVFLGWIAPSFTYVEL